MPHAVAKGSSSASSTDFEPGRYPHLSTQGVIDDASYAEFSLPNSPEVPLSEQLEPIAVIGMGCRLPGNIRSASDLWEMIINRKTGQTPKVPSSRFNIDAHFHKRNDRPGSFGVLGGYFLDETLQEFDPAFFGITPVEAMWMDPQQRKLLEVVYESFESAGITLDDVSGSDTACFIATFTADFQQMSFKEHNFRHSLAATGVDPGIISNRISHVFNLKGPSIVVNTACSSSVYAIHNACNALRTKECTAAVVGGSNLILTVDQHMNTAKLGVLSPTSECHTFNEYADGYGRAEAVGAIYLKRLSDAIRDGNPIRGIIRSTATNNNGKVPGYGITHPSYDGQCAVIQHAYQRGGQLDPRLTGYFECHGTGTAIGDPLEVNAIANSMNQQRDESHGPLLIGAIKPNIGHSEAASGISAIIKAVLAVERGIIPPTYGVTRLNPKIDWNGWKVKTPTEPMPFPSHLAVRRASVNSFGYGGTNAHIIVEGADSLLTDPQRYRYVSQIRESGMRVNRKALERNRPFLLLFSAHDTATLKRNLEAHGKVAMGYNLLDLSYTLANHRTHFASRAMTVTANSRRDTAFNDFQDFSFADKKKSHKLAFVFTGQGAQWARMGAELMVCYPSFLQSIRELDMVLERLDEAPDWVIEDTLLEDPKTSRVNEAEYSQPLCTAVQIALVQLLRAWGITPSITCGHSSGEIAAAFAANFISAPEAIILAYFRGRVVKDINTNGAMLAVGLGADAVAPYMSDINDEVVIACHNSPSSVTLSGASDKLEIMQKRMAGDNIFARAVKTGGKAYHSHHMNPAAAQYEALVCQAKKALFLEPTQTFEGVKMISSLTGFVVSETSVLDEEYWSANLRNPVLFNQAMQILCSSPEFDDVDTIIEIGPHSALSGPIRQIKTEFKFEKMQYLPSLIRGEDSAVSMLKLAGELFLRDYPLDLHRISAIEERSMSGKVLQSTGGVIVDLPPYQWDPNKKFWAESRESHEHRHPRFMRHDILGSQVPGTSLAEPSWRNFLRMKDLLWLKDHCLGGEAVFPAAAYFSMAIEAVTQLNEKSLNPADIHGYVLRDVRIEAALVVPDDDSGIEVMLNMRPSTQTENDPESTWQDFTVSSMVDGRVKDHMVGRICINNYPTKPSIRQPPNLPQKASGKSWNEALKRVGFYYGPTFQDMKNIRFDGKTYAATCDTTIKTTVDGMEGESRYTLHPATVDSCLQLLIVANWAGRANAMTAGAVPIQVDQVSIWKPNDAQIVDQHAKAFSWIDPRGVRSFNGHSQLTANGEVLMEISNMRCTAYEAVVPQQEEGVLRTQPYSEILWKPDVTLLSNPVNFDISSFTELVHFKEPYSKVLSTGWLEELESVLAKIPTLSLTISEPPGGMVDSIREALGAFHNTSVQKLDLGEEINSSFDLIISAANLVFPISTLRRLLNTGGRAIVPATMDHSPDELACANFSPNVLNLRDGYVVITAVESTSNSVKVHEDTSYNIQLVYRQKPIPLTHEIQKILQFKGANVTTSSIESIDKIGEHIVLADFEDPLLSTITEQEFRGLQELTSNASSILWLTSGGLLSGKRPEFALTPGLIRSLTSEQISLDIIHLDFDTDNTPEADIAQIAAHYALEQSMKSNILEKEYYISEGKSFISRLIPSRNLNSQYSRDDAETEMIKFDTDLSIVGKLQSGKVIFEVDSRVNDPLARNYLEIKVLTTGLNKEDTIIISGTDFLTDFTHEVGGIVTRVGSAVENFAPGDRVIGFSFDKFATLQQADARLFQRLNADENLVDMTSLPMAYAVALHGLKSLANLQPGETTLILPGSGVAGVAAIHATRALGGRPYVVASNNEQASSIRVLFSLDHDQVLVQSNTTQLRDIDGQYQVDVVFSSGWVNPSISREVWRHLSPFGRFIDCGRKDVLTRSVLDTVPLNRGASYLSFDILDLYNAKPDIMAQLLALTVNLYRQGRLPLLQPISLGYITELDRALSAFSDDFEAGKTIVKHESAGDGYLPMLAAEAEAELDPNGTYFLVGCLGGLGRSLTSRMMKLGARNFFFLSRSGADSDQAYMLVENLRQAGANVKVFKGDASVYSDVEEAVKAVPVECPVRGVINAAMVLRDGLFYNMPFENWVASTSPKVKGSINLHEAFKDHDLDFFITTSSVSGTLGTPGQSNYAAGNSFLDSLARHRRAQKNKSTSIILPMILGVGVVAESTELEETLKSKWMYGIDEEALLRAFEVAILESKNQAAGDHFVAGLDPSELSKTAKEAEGELDSFWAADVRFKHLVHQMKSINDNATAGSNQTILSSLKEMSLSDAIKAVRMEFLGRLERVLLLEIDKEEEHRSIASYGIDSMIGAELRNWIFKNLGLDISFQQLLNQSLTVTQFAQKVCANQQIE
ncbi:lovastatin nonaketide synthase [Nannizzia gypsea CBS 118893]|uniref:Non-reducing polyketide synthase nscA n=1 Tax=Arthroderma gypseum (strain ATCC MYA-4604 / CBS 118893) TaxID=535722 RepID=E4V2U6_ARTGP|nr:lovastatin nonaketide synthase [Nannizzia gypsea CBS 118893]EFR04320.1 lovastatin nonaketide synthase [Nannizzia gypsea CBS 118893]